MRLRDCCPALFACNLLASGVVAAQPVADPVELQVPINAGPAILGEGRRVHALIADSGPEVCNLLCELGDRNMAIRPNGGLVSLLNRESPLTDRPFVPIARETLAKNLTAGQFKNFKSQYTKRFVYVYNTSEKFYVGTSRILETMYPAVLAYWDRLGVYVHDPDTPLLVLMFRTYAEYNQFSPVPEGIVAYYSKIPNYVVMYEDSPASSRNPAFFQKMAVGVVAHEGTHQILTNIGVNARMARWPGWIREGLAEYFGSTELGANVRWKGVGSVNDARMIELEEYIRENAKSIAAGESIRNTVRKPEFTSTDYAISWAMVHFLAQRRSPAFLAYLKDVCQMRPFEMLNSDQSEALFAKHFGEDYPGLESALVKHLSALPYTNPFASSVSSSKPPATSKRSSRTRSSGS